MNRNQKDLIVETIKPIKYRNCLYTMRIGQYEAEVNCTKKKEGRQFAAQKILKQLHPHIQNWGPMLRLYCAKMTEAILHNDDPNKVKNPTQNPPQKPAETKAKQAVAEEITQKAKPNKELLEKLKEEMRKLRKPAVGNGSNNGTGASKDSLLTIPPLELGNELGNGFLMVKDHENSNGKEKSQSSSSDNDGKILFSTNSNAKEYSELSSTAAKKRRIFSGSEKVFYDKDDSNEKTDESGDGEDSVSDKTSDEEEEGEISD